MIRSLRRQLGYLYLTTGGNGAGKTLFTLWDVRQLQLKTGRPVFFWGFNAKQPLLDFGWQEFEPAKWQDLPDGSICIVDECQKVMPTRATGQPPAWIGALAEDNRKRGFDFFFITQHPLNIDSFVRRLIAAPSWHRHFKASSMGDASNELKWSAVLDQPQKDGSSKSGEVTSRKWPREVYDWYTSTSMDTRKTGIPVKVWYGIGALLLAIVCVVVVGYQFLKMAQPDASAKPAAPASVVSPLSTAQRETGSRGNQAAPLSLDEYLDARKPRIPDFPHTAPVYDQATAPTVAPYPAACVQMGKTCKCYTQQATLLQVSGSVCLQIVAQGFFMDWQQPQQPHQQAPANPATQAHQPQAPIVQSLPVPLPPLQQTGQITQAELTTALRLRNPQYLGQPNASSFD